jgi:Restriction endonuclease fold toxin 9
MRQLNELRESALCRPGPNGGENTGTRRGREAHVNYGTATSGDYSTTFRLPSGRQPDAVDRINGIVRELKPNNPRAIQRGERQVEQYCQELEQQFGIPFRSYVDTYQP